MDLLSNLNLGIYQPTATEEFPLHGLRGEAPITRLRKKTSQRVSATALRTAFTFQTLARSQFKSKLKSFQKRFFFDIHFLVSGAGILPAGFMGSERGQSNGNRKSKIKNRKFSSIRNLGKTPGSSQNCNARPDFGWTGRLFCPAHVRRNQ